MDDRKIFLFPVDKVSCSFLAMSNNNSCKGMSLKHAGLVFWKVAIGSSRSHTQKNRVATRTHVVADFVA
jgi:hypothetical protein